VLAACLLISLRRFLVFFFSPQDLTAAALAILHVVSETCSAKHARRHSNAPVSAAASASSDAYTYVHTHA
jgi:hypothetical protein